MGSIRKAPRTGRWEARYRDPAGVQRTQTFDSKTAARAFLAVAETDVQRGEWVDPALGQTGFATWAEGWLATVVHLEMATQFGYRADVHNHLVPFFGQTPVARITQRAVRQLLAELKAAGYSASTIRGIFAALRLIMATAVADGLIKVSPCAGVRLPPAVRREMVCLTPEQVAVLAAAIGRPYDMVVTFAAYTGLRAGEIGALRVRRLDLLRGTVDVAEALKDHHGRMVMGPTKSKQRRTVPLPRFLCEEMASYLADRPHGPDDLVFTAPDGGLLNHNNFYKRRFRPAVARAGLPDALRFHDLRHTYVAILIAQGAHPKAIADRTGHSSPNVTMSTYAHLLPGLEAQLTERLDAVFRSACGVDVVHSDAEVVELPQHAHQNVG
jgi:integrase